MTDKFNMREEKPEDVRILLKTAKQRREESMKYQLLSELLDGKTINVTTNTQLFEALNRENLEFDEILKLHPEEVEYTIKYVKQRKAEQGNTWYNPKSKAKWGEKGAIPPCCYYARPNSYWKNKKLMNHFLNTYSKFRISEGRL